MVKPETFQPFEDVSPSQKDGDVAIAMLVYGRLISSAKRKNTGGTIFSAMPRHGVKRVATDQQVHASSTPEATSAELIWAPAERVTNARFIEMPLYKRILIILVPTVSGWGWGRSNFLRSSFFLPNCRLQSDESFFVTIFGLSKHH